MFCFWFTDNVFVKKNHKKIIIFQPKPKDPVLNCFIVQNLSPQTSPILIWKGKWEERLRLLRRSLGLKKILTYNKTIQFYFFRYIVVIFQPTLHKVVIWFQTLFLMSLAMVLIGDFAEKWQQSVREMSAKRNVSKNKCHQNGCEYLQSIIPWLLKLDLFQNNCSSFWKLCKTFSFSFFVLS